MVACVVILNPPEGRDAVMLNCVTVGTRAKQAHIAGNSKHLSVLVHPAADVPASTEEFCCSGSSDRYLLSDGSSVIVYDQRRNIIKIALARKGDLAVALAGKALHYAIPTPLCRSLRYGALAFVHTDEGGTPINLKATTLATMLRKGLLREDSPVTEKAADAGRDGDGEEDADGGGGGDEDTDADDDNGVLNTAIPVGECGGDDDDGDGDDDDCDSDNSEASGHGDPTRSDMSGSDAAASNDDESE